MHFLTEISGGCSSFLLVLYRNYCLKVVSFVFITRNACSVCNFALQTSSICQSFLCFGIKNFKGRTLVQQGPSFFMFFCQPNSRMQLVKRKLFENDPKDFYVCLNILHIGVGGNNLVFFSDAKSVIQSQCLSSFYKDNSKNSGLKFYMFSLVGKT